MTKSLMIITTAAPIGSCFSGADPFGTASSGCISIRSWDEMGWMNEWMEKSIRTRSVFWVIIKRNRCTKKVSTRRYQMFPKSRTIIQSSNVYTKICSCQSFVPSTACLQTSTAFSFTVHTTPRGTIIDHSKVLNKCFLHVQSSMISSCITSDYSGID